MSGFKTNTALITHILNLYTTASTPTNKQTAPDDKIHSQVTQPETQSPPNPADPDHTHHPVNASSTPCTSTPSCPKSLSDSYIPSMFVGEQRQIFSLIDIVHEHAILCGAPFVLCSSYMRQHVLVTTYKCECGHVLSWNSSSDLRDRGFLVNERMYLASIASGIIPAQYKKFSQFGCIGTVSNSDLAEKLPRFAGIVSFLQRHSTNSALAEERVKGDDQDVVEGTITVMTDARHACRKNSYNTDHVTIGQMTHKVLDIQHITKEDDVVSQRHEHLACSRMYEAMDDKGIAISEHVHDRNTSINKLVKARGIRNVNERWHVAKSIKSGMKKIGQGTKRDCGKTWHPQLADKTTAVRDHVYWCIHNCYGNPEKLRQLLDASVRHFQNIHDQCDASSSCKGAHFVPSLYVLTEAVAVKLLSDFLHSHGVYKNADDFAFPRDTYYVESFNNVCLVYLPKRVHFQGQLHYELRMGLAVLDWNEHVDREATSISNRMSAEHHRQQRGRRVLPAKSFRFVQDIWTYAVDQCDFPNEIPAEETAEHDHDDSGLQSDCEWEESDVE